MKNSLNPALNHSGLGEELKRIESVYAQRQTDARYSLFEPSHLLAVQERERKLLHLLIEAGHSSLQNLRILEVGCGRGDWLRDFIRWGARAKNICGMDLSASRIADARLSLPSTVDLAVQDCSNLPHPDAGFDLVLQSTVFSSVLNLEMRSRMAQEMMRVVKQQGLILWYDLRVNNPSNPDVRGISRDEILHLFPGFDVSLRKLTLAPPLARRITPISTFLYRSLSCIKPLCTHYLGIIRKS